MAKVMRTKTVTRGRRKVNNGNSKRKASRKGSKVNLQFSTKEREYFKREAGFTDEEIEIFRMRSRGFSVVKISTEMTGLHDKYYSVSTIEARIRSIKDKILRIL